jgi:hypothetical protein
VHEEVEAAEDRAAALHHPYDLHLVGQLAGLDERAPSRSASGRTPLLERLALVGEPRRAPAP